MASLVLQSMSCCYISLFQTVGYIKTQTMQTYEYRYTQYSKAISNKSTNPSISICSYSTNLIPEQQNRCSNQKSDSHQNTDQTLSDSLQEPRVPPVRYSCVAIHVMARRVWILLELIQTANLFVYNSCFKYVIFVFVIYSNQSLLIPMSLK